MLCLSQLLQEFVISVVLRGILVRSQLHTLVVHEVRAQKKSASARNLERWK